MSGRANAIDDFNIRSFFPSSIPERTMTERDRLYDAFTGEGKLTQRWSACGVRTTYDPETKDLTFELPGGWTDTTTEDTRAERRSAWERIGDPTHNIEYEIDLRREAEEDGECETKLVASENDGAVEFRTKTDFEGLNDVPLGSTLLVEVRALAKTRKRDSIRFVLFRGKAVVPERPSWLSENVPGFFYVLDEGFVVSFNTLAGETDGTVRVVHVSFMGRQKNLDDM